MIGHTSREPWEEVYNTDHDMMERTPVVGGWIYRNLAFHSSDANIPQMALTFVPAGAAIPPSIIDNPVITGSSAVGSTLSCSTGNWDNEPTSYTYQWQSAGTNISGATNSIYVTQNSDSNNVVTCVVTATNAAGSASATSNAIMVTPH